MKYSIKMGRLVRKIKKRSITLKLFFLIFTLVIFISGIIGILVIGDTSKLVKKEMDIMRTQVLDEVANNISILLSNVENIGNNVVLDSKLIDILSIPKEKLPADKNLKKKMDSYVEGLLVDEIWTYVKYNMKPELYIIGNNGLTYSTYSKTKYDLESIKNESWYNEIKRANGNTVLINTYKDGDGIGPYKNIFKMGRIIKDLITDEVLGILIMDISEIMLYERYSDMLDDGSEIYIVDSNKKIISSKDKRLIGQNYEEIKKVKKRNFIFTNIEIESFINEYEWSIVQEIPLSIMMKVSIQIAKKTFFIIALVSIIALIITYKLSVWITKPIIDMKNKMEEVMDGNLKVNVDISNDDEIGQLQISFNQMVEKLDLSIENIKKYEKQKRVAELSFLQAQINPHFLYNTLSSIRFLISMNQI